MVEMIKGIGIDVIEIDRIEKALARRKRLLNRLFRPQEVVYCRGRSRPGASFAARFAAKEALRKACGLINGVIPWCEIEISMDGGKPQIFLLGKSAQMARQHGITSFFVSLSHSKNHACAVVVAIGE